MVVNRFVRVQVLAMALARGKSLFKEGQLVVFVSSATSRRSKDATPGYQRYSRTNLNRERE